MKNLANAFLAAAVLICMIPAAAFALAPYSQDFEGMDQSSSSALADDGWLIFGNVFSPGGDYLYGYGVFTAPNDGAGFCQVVLGEGGAEQGDQQLANDDAGAPRLFHRLQRRDEERDVPERIHHQEEKQGCGKDRHHHFT